MESKRVALPSILSTRDATVAKDELLVNCYTEKGPDAERVVKRPGTWFKSNLTSTPCPGQGAYFFVNKPVFVTCDELHVDLPPRLSGDNVIGTGQVGNVGVFDPTTVTACPENWRWADLIPQHNLIYGVAWNGSHFCAATNYFVATSPTGEFWNYNPNENFPFVIHSEIVWNGFTFCTIGHWDSGPGLNYYVHSFTSGTGHPGTWSSHYIFGPGIGFETNYALGTLGTRIVAVPMEDGNQSLASNNGMSWTTGALPSVEKWESIAGGNGVFVTAAHYRNYGAISTNGNSWTPITMPFAARWSAVAFNGEYFCYVCYNRYPSGNPISAISYNGYDWIAGTNPMGGTFYDNVCWEPVTRRWFSVEANLCSMSTNGLDWTSCPMGLTITDTATGLASNGVNLCAVGGVVFVPGREQVAFAPLF